MKKLSAIFSLSLSLSLSLLLLTPLSAAAESAIESTAESAAGSSFAETDSSYKTISKTRYITGGVLSIVLGSGIGHAVQGRWMEKGWIFTASGLLINGFFFYTLFSSIEDVTLADEAKASRGLANAGIALGVSLLVKLGVQIWEIADAWTLPSHYKVVSKPFQLSPLVYYDGKSQNLSGGLSLKYRF